MKALYNVMSRLRTSSALLAMLLVFSIIFCFVQNCYSQFSATSPQLVSLTALVGDPSRYSGKKVRVAGWLHYSFEDNALYLTQCDSDFNITCNAVWVGFTSTVKCEPQSQQGLKYFHCKPVWVVGTFDPSRHGHMDLYSGCIMECEMVSRIWKPGVSRTHVGD